MDDQVGALDMLEELNAQALALVRPLDEPGDIGDRELVEGRSEEHTSELQSRPHLVCRLLLEKKNTSPPRRCAGRASPRLDRRSWLLRGRLSRWNGRGP